MTNPNIIFTSPGIAEVTDKEIPEISGENEVRIKIVSTTISSGTERANLVGDPNVHGRYAPCVNFPRQAGYSASGVVDAVGSGVKNIKVGDRVAASWTKHARYVTLSKEKVYPLAHDVSFADASMVHIATFPMAAIRKCRTEIGESGIVMGLGVLGLIGVKLLRCAGVIPIIAVDPNEKKRKQALEIGADYALNPFDKDFNKKVRSLTNGGANVALEITGLGQGLDMVLDCMADFGRVALLGCTRNSDFTIDYYRKVHSPGISLIGAHTMARPKSESWQGMWTERDDAMCIIRLIHMGRLKLADLVETTYSPHDAPDIYKKLAQDSVFPVVQFEWDK